jgi:hypothetical protein
MLQEEQSSIYRLYTYDIFTTSPEKSTNEVKSITIKFMLI